MVFFKTVLFCMSILLVLQIFCDQVVNGEHILRRKRRYVTFPVGSSVGVQSVLSKPFLDYSFPSDWNWGVEYTVSFKLPNDTLHNLQRLLAPQHEVHRRDRRHVYEQIEAILQLHEVNGKACVLRAVCESKFLLRPGKSLWQDLLHVIFRGRAAESQRYDSVKSGGYDEAVLHEDCEPWIRNCPVSLLGVLLATVT